MLWVPCVGKTQDAYIWTFIDMGNNVWDSLWIEVLRCVYVVNIL
jgi:hypothetical protein